MNKNVFLAVLGTGNYNDTIYYFENKNKELTKTKYVQKAIIELVKEKTLEKALIFVTEEARKKHALALKQECEQENIQVEFIDIPEAKNNTDIWNIFSKMYESIPENSHLIIDITHGFRYIPMLLVLLLPYSKILKKVELEGIYYGELSDTKSEPCKGKILDISDFHVLQEWILAIHDFIEHGKPNKIKELIYKDVNPILKETKGKDNCASTLKKISNGLQNFYEYIEVCRGKDITSAADFYRISEYIDNIQQSEDIIPAFRPLIGKISETFKGYEKDTLNNHEKAIEYCIEKGKIQQVATLLEEYCTSCIEEKIYEVREVTKSELKNKDIRIIISNYLGLKGKSSSDIVKDWDYKTNYHQAENTILNILEQIPEIKKFAQVVDKIKQLRNNINHAGYTQRNRITYDDIEKELNDNYKQIIQSLKSISSAKINLPTQKIDEKKGFLLNISNHLFENWSDVQKNTAIHQFNKVVDLPFPNIPPEYTSEQINKMVKEWIQKINNDYPDCTAIHIMGEFNFTFQFVSQMKDTIPCYASTTERKVEMLPDGTRKMYFDFVQFRRY